ncbi:MULTISPECIES: phage holin family protein [Enterococcus]|nr:MULTISPECIES: phage holin family protein [Enterococcus]MBA0950097.1 phage holin family protein [Enterococcus gallinarum]MBA0963025.1 phage holin family protein [Enterococcus gallinarum]MBA0970952.1 phage holin family protein [Enterococcus gallinarum]MCR1912482.1 phage holin family protein [Enterococcus hirae]QKX74312.1 phage holin family protein [Enterococcus hirae]
MESLSTEMILAMCGLYVAGKVLKEIPKFPNWGIPLALTVISCIGTPLLFGGYTVFNFFVAIVAVGITVYGDQLWKRTNHGIKELDEGEDEK